MPNIVTFDTVNLHIIEIPVFAGSPEVMQDNELTMQEIYSEWKEFAAQTAGSPATGDLGFPTAIRIVGGDPTSDVENLGITYFMINGWRLKPAEGNHRLVIEGNTFTDPSGQSVFAFADGNFQVNCELKFTNLIDGIRQIGADAELTRQLAQNRTHTDPGTGIMTVFDDNDVDILLQGDLFEDVAATQDYRGQGADRRNRLI